MKKTAAIAAAALAMAVSSFAFAEIKGKVTLDGKPPEMKEIDMSAVKECATQHADPVTEQTVVADDKGNLANVIVAVKKEEGKELGGEVPSEPAVLDQKGCMYEPHVLGLMAGQEMVVKNDDPFLHNVHALSTVNQPFNFGQPTKDEEAWLAANLGRVTVPVTAMLETTMAAEELLKLNPGDIVALGHSVNQPIDVVVGKISRFAGRLAQNGHSMAVRVEARGGKAAAA